MKIKFALGLGLLGLAISNASFATDSKVYSGTGCFAQNGVNESKLLHTISVFNNQTSNTGFVRVSCPIVRDSLFGTNGIRAIVNVSRSSISSEPLVCRLSTHRKNGNTFRVVSFTHSGSGSVERVIANTSGISGGTYLLTCDLPRHSSVRRYHIEEL